MREAIEVAEALEYSWRKLRTREWGPEVSGVFCGAYLFLLRERLSIVLQRPLTAAQKAAAVAQMNEGDPHVPGAVGCNDSPTPGKRPPNLDCTVLLHKNFDTLPLGPLVWRFENFPTTEAARAASTPASAVVEAAGKVWLLTLTAKGGHSKGAMFVAETELLPPIPRGPSYEIVVSQADLDQMRTS